MGARLEMTTAACESVFFVYTLCLVAEKKKKSSSGDTEKKSIFFFNEFNDL